MHEYVFRRRRKDVNLSNAKIVSSERVDVARAQPAVVTIIEPVLRSSIDQAAGDKFLKVHVGSVAEGVRAVSLHSASALLLSPSIIGNTRSGALADLILKHPRITPVVVLGRAEPLPVGELLGLGACGVRQFVDVNYRAGWEQLRSILDQSCARSTESLVSLLLPMFDGATDETRHFFARLIRAAPRVSKVKTLASAFDVEPSTLMSRFFRAGLPAPRMYLALTRLAYAAWFLETSPTMSGAEVSNQLDYSSPQSFARHVRSILGVRISEFRLEYSVAHSVAVFSDRLIVPYRKKLNSFRPISLRIPSHTTQRSQTP